MYVRATRHEIHRSHLSELHRSVHLITAMICSLWPSVRTGTPSPIISKIDTF